MEEEIDEGLRFRKMIARLEPLIRMQNQPTSFEDAFKNCTNLTSVPAGLFKGKKGAPNVAYPVTKAQAYKKLPKGPTYLLHWSVIDAIKDLQNSVDKISTTINMPLFKLQ